VGGDDGEPEHERLPAAVECEPPIDERGAGPGRRRPAGRRSCPPDRPARRRRPIPYVGIAALAIYKVGLGAFREENKLNRAGEGPKEALRGAVSCPQLMPTTQIKDPVHGYVELPDALVEGVVDTRPFQRLRYVRQLSATHLVYPGANHTRFEHSLGVYHLGRTVFENLRQSVVLRTGGDRRRTGRDPAHLRVRLPAPRRGPSALLAPLRGVPTRGYSGSASRRRA